MRGRPGTVTLISRRGRGGKSAVDEVHTTTAWRPFSGACYPEEFIESVVSAIEQGALVVEHPNQHRYPGQLIYVVEIDEYLHLVPFVETDGTRFLKTIIPSRKATPAEAAIVNKEMSAEESDIVDRFERGELVRSPSPDAEGELEAARQAARNTFSKTRRVP